MLQRVASLLRMKPPLVEDVGLLSVSGGTVPVDGTVGYQPGCIFQDTTNGVLYVNEGSVTSSNFDVTGGVRAASDSIVFTGTQAAGNGQKLIDFDAAVLAAGSSNQLWSYGDALGGAVSVTITDYYFPVRMNVESIANPGSTRLASLMFLKFATSTADQANLEIQGIGLTVDIGKNVGYVHAFETLLDASDTVTVTGEAVAGKFTINLTAAKTLTAHTSAVLMAELKGTGSYATSGGPRMSCFLAKVGTGVTTESMIEISNSGTATNGIFFSSQGGITNAFKFGGQAGETGADVAASCDNVASDAAIKIDINGTTYYVPAFTAGNTTNSW